MVQIGGYLTADEHAEFKRYSAGFQLKESSLANLLIARELKLGRLARLKQEYRPPAEARQRSRITAHQPDGRIKQVFDDLAAAAGLTPDQAATVLYRAELAERWLEKALSADM